MSIKYLVFGGTIRSKSDNDDHFIGGNRLVELYKVPFLECVIDNPQGSWQETESRRDYLKCQYPSAIILKPDYHGIYKVPDPSPRLN